jgi:hypothetical protein
MFFRVAGKMDLIAETVPERLRRIDSGRGNAPIRSRAGPEKTEG